MLKFNKIEYGNVFTRDFRPLMNNNVIEFSSNEQIAVIYGPNGTGKTSLIKVFSDINNSKIEFEYAGTTYSSGKQIFHIINDQNSRNIISGETKDFILGDNIRKEFELREFIEGEEGRIKESIISALKSKYKIAAANSNIISCIETQSTKEFIKDIANTKSKGKNYNTEKLISTLLSIATSEIPEHSEEKLTFLKNDYAEKDSIILQIEMLVNKEIVKNQNVREIEENSEAIKILSKFKKDQCIVCDTCGINCEHLLANKTNNKKTIIESLDEHIQLVIEKIIEKTINPDPFCIKENLLCAIETGDKQIIVDLNNQFLLYKKILSSIIENDLREQINDSELAKKNAEYTLMIESKPEISEEDMIYIEEIISGSMNKKLSLARDEHKNLRIHLENQEFLGKDRGDLPLSAGEQNFLSLTFEFLKAKNAQEEIIVIDDPISSFDSIYKNKVVYAIVKMLQGKKRLLLTHNIDLLRLLNSQYSRCFRLYLLNNTEDEESGFIVLTQQEQDMLIDLQKLLLNLRKTIVGSIKNAELFLISLIPFMRGYANIVDKKDIYEKLTALMHGYKTEKIDVAKIFKELFGNSNTDIPDSLEMSVPDILSKNVDAADIVDKNKYPLLDKTLRHSFLYLFLRLWVEKSLVEKFSIDTTKYRQLGDIIAQSYQDLRDIDQIRKRTRLTSKKTLINEFNHFEGNLSIFQPAIDITDHALGKERTEILAFVRGL